MTQKWMRMNELGGGILGRVIGLLLSFFNNEHMYPTFYKNKKIRTKS